MEAKMSLKARLELLERVKERYKAATRQQKHQILQEFVESTGYHRKYALALLSKERVESVPTKRRSSHVKYTEEVQEALIYVWKAANEICPKRLIPFMPVFIDSLERTGHWPISESTKSLLLTLSTATAERLLRRERMQSNRGRSTTRAGKLLKKQIPIRTFSDWNDVEPGFLEADLVAHCGDNVHGAYLNTLTLTDIFSGWTECTALLQRGEREVSEGLTESRPQLPFPLRGLDTDNGSEFINFVLFDYCQAENITFTRSRPYKKNDQAHVEEKNGSVVRRMVGYDRYEGQEAQSALKTLYQSLRLYVNFFQPSMKLLSKKRDGAKVSKKYDMAQTPQQRLMKSNISDQSKDRLQKQFSSLDPVALLDQIGELQSRLWQHAWKPGATSEQKILASLLAPQSAAVQAQEVIEMAKPATQSSSRKYRQTKKPRKPMPPRNYRTHPDKFENVWAEVESALVKAPCQSAKELFQELQQKYPGAFQNNQIRTFQRRVKNWRSSMIRQLTTEKETATAPAVESATTLFKPTCTQTVAQAAEGALRAFL